MARNDRTKYSVLASGLHISKHTLMDMGTHVYMHVTQREKIKLKIINTKLCSIKYVKQITLKPNHLSL